MKNKHEPHNFTSGALCLAEFEELVMLAISGLEDRAYGIAIQQRLQEAGRKVSVGALYGTLQRLQEKQVIMASHRSAPTATRGGRSKLYYQLTRAGQGALDETEEVRSRLRAAAMDIDSNEASTSNETSAAQRVSSPNKRKSPISVSSVMVPVRAAAPSREKESPSPPPPPPPRPDYLPYYGN